jgi:hypothetical protein
MLTQTFCYVGYASFWSAFRSVGLPYSCSTLVPLATTQYEYHLSAYKVLGENILRQGDSLSWEMLPEVPALGVTPGVQVSNNLPRHSQFHFYSLPLGYSLFSIIPNHIHTLRTIYPCMVALFIKILPQVPALGVTPGSGSGKACATLSNSFPTHLLLVTASFMSHLTIYQLLGPSNSFWMLSHPKILPKYLL